MRKIYYIIPLCFVSAMGHADDASDISALQMRMKELEVRIGLIERDVSDIKASKVADVPLNQSNLPSAQVLIWADKTLEEIYAYNYRNFPQVLTNIRHYFTQAGYDSYMKALDESKNMQVVQDKKLAVSARATARGTVVKEALNNGIYTWDIQIPLQINYEGVSETFKQNIIANVEIVRVPTSDSPVGIAIHSITASVAPADPSNAPAAAPSTTDATKK